MYKRWLCFLKISFIFLAFINCTVDKTPISNISSIYDHVWKLERIINLNGDTILIPDSNWEYSIHVQQTGSLKVIAACNSGDGFISISNDNSIQIQSSCTEIACSNLNPSYLGYCDDLNLATSFEIYENKLRIYFTNRGGEEFILAHHR